jgi:hypothetical protein
VTIVELSHQENLFAEETNDGLLSFYKSLPIKTIKGYIAEYAR